MTSHPDPVQLIFDNAIRDFKAELKNDKLYNEISKAATIEDVYDVTDKLQKEQVKNGHLRHLSKIEPYLEGLRNYASVIEVFMQAKPDIIALLWGPIKVLLQWASTLKQSFDAIINATADIGALLPEFQDCFRLFGQNESIKDVLALFFKDILDFYIIALKFFSLPRWKYFFESLWPRHRDKIKVVVNHIERHTLLMRNEVRLEHIQAEHSARLRALEHFERTERSLQRQDYQAIETSVSPRKYEGKLDWLQGRTCEGTGKWMMKDAIFVQWLDPTESTLKLLWLQGIPGAGKTFLSSSVVDKTRAVGHTLYAFLSHNLIGSTSALSIFHSLIFQLTADDQDLREVLCQSSRENLKSNLRTAAALLSTLLNCAGSAYIIIDGVDEIDVVERSRLLKQILELSKGCTDTKILISSRPESDISRILDGEATTIRVDNRNSGSIQTFVTQYTQEWFQRRDFSPEAEEEIKGLLAQLAWKSKGMFLYAKVALNSIEHLDIREIRTEFRVLPETLDDVYARVLARINRLHPPRLRDKARKLLGWIGCSPTPLTIHELEQAVTITEGDMEASAIDFANLNIVQICGSIVEVVEEYVQFVHFTVQEYLFSPQISGYIDPTDATLSLAMCCITYLSQEHHDREIDDEEMAYNLLSGLYRFHEFATTMWLELIERVTRFYSLGSMPKELIAILETFLAERKNRHYKGTTAKSVERRFSSFKKDWPELHDILCKAAGFRHVSSKAEYNKNKATLWVNFDPLTISDTSSRIFNQMNQLLLMPKKQRGGQDSLPIIQRHHGQRPFKCGFLSCSFRRHGFEASRPRDAHVTYHDRPWRCSFPDCEFKDGGFLSRKMRDDHFDLFHQEEVAMDASAMGTPDKDELQPLLFDLVQADNVDAVKALREHATSLPTQVRRELLKLAAGSSSPPMLEFLELIIKPEDRWQVGWEDLALISIQGRNLENFTHLLLKSKADSREFGTRRYSHRSYAALGPEVLDSESEEILREWEKYVDLEFDSAESKRPAARMSYAAAPIIRATQGRADRELILLSLWKAKKLFEDCNDVNKGDALVNIASTTCSIKLAEFVTGCGAKVDFRRSDKYLTPLHHAARQTTAEAAKFMEFLLVRGADPEASAVRSNVRIRDEKGAKGISKWLDKSWDEVVAKAKAHMGHVDPKDDFGRTALWRAADRGDEAVVRELLGAGNIDVDSKDNDKQTPLLRASANGHERVVKALLEEPEMNIDLRDNDGRTPLSWAASNGHATVVKVLLKTGKVNVNSMDNESQTPLHVAAAKGHEAIVKVLQETGKVTYEILDSKGRSALFRAAEKGAEAVVEMLSKSSKFCAFCWDNDERTPLSIASANGNETIVKTLLKRDVLHETRRDKSGRTPLSWAAFNGHETIIKTLRLLRSDIDVNTKDNSGQTPLSLASLNGHEAAVKALLDIDTTEIDSKDNDGRTPLWCAAAKGHEVVVLALLATGKVDIDSKDNDGRTPLSIAAANAHEKVVLLLLMTGKADVDSKDMHGQTPLSRAAAAGHNVVTKVLETAKVDLKLNVEVKDELKDELTESPEYTTLWRGADDWGFDEMNMLFEPDNDNVSLEEQALREDAAVEGGDQSR